MTLRRTIIWLLAVVVVNAVASGWTAVYLLHDASETRAEQSLRAEARTEEVRRDVAELLDEVRDPAGDTRRDELFERAVRIEHLLTDLTNDRTLP